MNLKHPNHWHVRAGQFERGGLPPAVALYFSKEALKPNIDGPVKSLQKAFNIILANPGSSPGQAPESSVFRH
jgi:hypothetical protein